MSSTPSCYRVCCALSVTGVHTEAVIRTVGGNDRNQPEAVSQSVAPKGCSWPDAVNSVDSLSAVNF